MSSAELVALGAGLVLLPVIAVWVLAHLRSSEEQPMERDLPYLQVVPKECADGVVMRKDGAFVGGLEVELVSFETVVDEELEEASARLSNVLRSLPEGYEVQVSVSRDMVKRLRVPSCTSEHPTMQEFHRVRCRHLAANVTRVLENTAHIFVSWKPDRTQPGYWSVLGANLWSSVRARDFREREHETLLKAFQAAMSGIETSLREAGHESRPLGTQELVTWIRRAANPGAEVPETEVGPWEYLADRVGLEEVDVHVNYFRSGTRYVAVLSHRSYPDVVIPFCLSPMMRLPFPFRFVLGIDVTNQAAELKAQQSAFRQAYSFSNRSTVSGHEAAPDKIAQTKFVAHNAVIDAMVSQNARLLPVAANLVLWAEPGADETDGEVPEVLENRVRQAMSAWTQSLRGSDMLREGLSSYAVWLSTLPGWMTPSGRRRKYLSPKVADMMAGLFAGRASGGNCGRSTYLTREGALVPFSVFDVDRKQELLAKNMLIKGGMGGGKSVTIGSICLGELAMRDLWLRLIDVGGSNAEWAQILGGVVQRFSLSSKDTDVVNPLMVDDLDEDALDYLLGFLSVLLTKESEDGFDMAVEGHLAKLLKKLYNDNPTPGAIILSDVERALLAHQEPRVKELGARLGYVTEGPYGRILNRRSERNLAHERIVYYDFQGCPDRLIHILLHAVTYDVMRMANRVGPKYPKLIPIDEAWRIFKAKGRRASSGLIDYVGRCSRKLKASTIFCSQSLGEFNTPELRDSVINNAEIQFIYKSDREDMAEMSRVFKLNEAELDNIQSLRTIKGEFSEAYLIRPRSRGVVRSRLCPEYYWLLTTDADDRAFREETYERFEGQKWAAVQWLARTYPKGLEASGKLGAEQQVEELQEAA